MKAIVMAYLLVFVTVLLSAGALIYVSQNVQKSERDLVRANAAIAREEESIRVLEAEWSYLNRPERIERLAKQHLDMIPPNPEQVVTTIPTIESEIPNEEVVGEEEKELLRQDVSYTAQTQEQGKSQ